MILQVGHPILRQKARAILASDFASRKLEEIIEKMFSELAKVKDGVALAAPQIGVPLRLFVVSEMALPQKSRENQGLVCLNPEIVRYSRKKIYLEEGCLSATGIYGWVRRSEKVTLAAFDCWGKKFIYHASGFLAQIFQHEIDHLDGLLIIDRIGTRN